MNRLLIIVYEICLWILALIAIPRMLYYFFVHKKYHQSLLLRLGFNYPNIEKNEQPLIWIHAVSVGETKAIVSLARELKLSYPTSRLVVSSVTETGQAEAKRSLPFADFHVFLPFDFYWLVRRIIRKASPQLVILCESDFWFNFLRCAKKQGASLALLNGKMSSESEARFCKIPFFSRMLFNLFDILCVQNELYRKRFLQVGAATEKLKVTGNLKLDDEYPRLSDAEVREWREKLGISTNQVVLTVGSSHYPEEQLILDLAKDIWNRFPQLKVILVPRHPERFKEVATLLENERLEWISFTDINRRTGKEQIILIDAMGMLRMCYQLSDIALVAGSFTTKVGGHNILEPCWYGKPVLFGPSMYSQLELVDLIQQAQAGMQVTQEQLGKTLEEWLMSDSLRHEIGHNGLRLIQNLKGSTKRTLNAIEPILCKIK